LSLTTNTNGDVLAAASGRLSEIPPLCPARNPLIPIDIPDATEPLPADAKLFLHLSPGTIYDPMFNARMNDDAWSFLNAPLLGFMYSGLETASLEAGLGDLLDTITLGRAGITRAQAVQLLLRGVASVRVPGGHPIGKGAPFGAGRRVAFAALVWSGPRDPVHMYDWMRDFVQDGQQAVDDFLAVMPTRWPLLFILPIIGFIIATNNTLYSMSVLEEMRAKYSLTPSQWRQVGDNQKALWRNRLLQRFGHGATGSTVPPFEFDDTDWQNVFQLEALTELFLNFNDPLRPMSSGAISGENVPRAPILANGSPDPAYKNVDFVPPAGILATVARNMLAGTSIITLDNPVGLLRVRPGYDTISLDNDASLTQSRYLITEVDVAAGTVTINGTPTLTVSPTPWEICLRPYIVIVDSFGPRMWGNTALLINPVELQLDGAPSLATLNLTQDTIYLSGDSARATRTYRIIRANNVTHTVTLDASPLLAGGSSTWEIQGGVSGRLPAMAYNLTRGASGFDHYDGVAFVVFHQSIITSIRWTSYTSRAHAIGSQSSSSIRGNKQYEYMSYRSGNAFKNYCFKVTDPRAQGDWVREARFYFETPVREDKAIAPAIPVDGGPGKTEIRLHDSNTQATNTTGSDGCVVSANIYELRDAIVRAYQAERWELVGSIDAEVQKVFTRNRAQSQALYNAAPAMGGLTSAHWDNKLVGTLYLIRPDERPVG
jgi:hypothetical protein